MYVQNNIHQIYTGNIVDVIIIVSLLWNIYVYIFENALFSFRVCYIENLQL